MTTTTKTKRIGEQLADREYVKYLQRAIDWDYYVVPHRPRIKTKEEFEQGR